MHGVQEPKLFPDEEQKDHDRTPGVQEILSVLPETSGAQGDQVGFRQAGPGMSYHALQ
jgi:hypothetical protein